MRFSRTGKIFASGVIAAGAVFVTSLPALAATTIGATINAPASSIFNATTWSTSFSGTSTPTSPATLSATANVLTLKDTTASPNTYWNGTNFTTTAATVNATTVPASGNWTYTGPGTAKLISGHSYSLTDTVTDSGSNNATSAARTFGYQTTAPVAAVSFPVTGTTYSATSPSLWNAISGTASATSPATVSSNTLTIKDTTASPNTYWTGSAWSSALSTVTATGTTSWSYTLNAANLTSGHSYSVTDKVADTATNNFTTTAVTFGYNTTAPAASVTYPVANTTYGTDWAGSISGTASATSPATVATNTLTIRDTTASPNTYWNGTSFTSTLATVAATGTTSWTYSIARTAFISTHVYTVIDKAVDSASNSTTTSALTFTYAPVSNGLAYSSPVNGSTWAVGHAPTSTNGTLTLTAKSCLVITMQNTTNATQWDGTRWVSSGGTTSRLYLPIPNGPDNFWNATNPGASSSWTWGLPFLATGSYYWQTWAYAYPGSGGCLTSATAQSSLPTMVPSTNPISSINVSLPSTVINDPVDGTVYFSNTWAGVDGTSTGGDAGTKLSTVSYTIKNTTTGLYWNGSNWVVSNPNLSIDLSANWSRCTINADSTRSCAWLGNLPSSTLVAGQSYTMTASTTDSLGNVSPTVRSSWQYEVPPVTAISYPVDGSNYGSNWSGAITGTAGAFGDNTLSTDTLTIHDTTANLYWTGTAWTSTPSTVTVTPGTSWSFSLDIANLTNSHSYTVTNVVTDSLGYASNTATSTFNFWNQAPTTTITSPIDGYTYGANFSGSFSGTSGSAGVTSIVDSQMQLYDNTSGLWWDGSQWSLSPSWFSITPGGSWSWPFDPADLTSGHHYTLTNVVTDGLGNVSLPAVSTFDYNTVSPDTTINFPSNGATYNATTWTGTISGLSDSGESLALQPSSFAYSLYDSTSGLYWDANHQTWVATDPGNTISFNINLCSLLAHLSMSCDWSINIDWSFLTSGHSYTFGGITTDNAGNTSNLVTTDFNYLSNPPSTSITTPVDGTTYNTDWPGLIDGTSTPQGSNTISSNAVTIYDATAGLWWNGVSWQASAVTVSPTGLGSWSLSISLADLCQTAGSCPASGHTFNVSNTTIDDQGQATTSSTSSFTLDIAAPTTTITTPVDGSIIGGGYQGSINGTSAGLKGATISLNTLTIKDNTANGGAGLWWNGTTWQDTATTINATGGATWSFSLSLASLCHTIAISGCPGSGDSFTITNVATDNNGLVSDAATTTFTLVTAPPTIAITSYQNSTRYGEANWPGGTSGYISGPLTAGTNLLEPSTVQIQILRKNLSYQGVQYSDYWNPIGTGCDPAVGSQIAADYPANPASCWTATPAYSPTTWSSTTSPNWGPPDESPQLHPTLSNCLNYGTATPRSCTWSYYFPSSWMQNGVTYTSRVIGADTAGNAVNAVKCWTYWNYGPAVSASTITTLTPSLLTFTGTAGEQVACYVACSYNSTPPPPYVWIKAAITDVKVTIKDVTANQYWTGAGWQTDPVSVSASTSNNWANWTYTLPSGANYPIDNHHYQLSAIAIDSSGNHTIYPFYDSNGNVTPTQPTTNFTYSSSPPQAAVTSPSNTSTVGKNYTGWIGGTSTGSGSMKVAQTTLTIQDRTSGQYWNGTIWQNGQTSVTVPATGSSGTVPPVTTWKYYGLDAKNLTSGRTYDVYAVATDEGTNSSSPTHTSFRYYTTGPTGAVTYPTAISYGANWISTLRGTVSVASGAPSVAAVTLQIRDTNTSQYWNGTDWQTDPTTVTPTGTTSWTYPLSSGALTSGHIYWIIVNAVDVVGNNSSSAPSNFTYNTTAPTVNIQAPVNGTIYGNNWGGSVRGNSLANGTLKILSNAVVIQDTTNGKYWSGSAWVAQSTQITATGTTTWSAALPAANLTNGHSYRAVASSTDSGQNQATTGAVTFTYDIVPPSIAVTYPVGGTSYTAGTWTGYISGTATGHGGKTIAVVTAGLMDQTTNQYWNGTSWQATGAKLPATINPSNNTWRTAVPSSALTPGHTYLATSLAIDSGGVDPGSAPVKFKFTG